MSLVTGSNVRTSRSSMRPTKRSGSARIQCTAAERYARSFSTSVPAGIWGSADGLASLGEIIVCDGQGYAATPVKRNEGPQAGILPHPPRGEHQDDGAKERQCGGR